MCESKKHLSTNPYTVPLFCEMGWWDKKFKYLPENVGL